MEVIVKKFIALFVVVALFACSKAESTSSTDSAVPEAAAADASQGRMAGSPASTVPESPATPKVPRMIVRTAEMRITVADTTKTVDAVTKAVEAMGGFVSGSNVWREGELLRATLKLRVPADKLTSTLASIRRLAKRVDTETIASDDVSQEFVDLESQVRNLEATENELRELLIVARQNSKKAADVLEVHEQLTIIRGQIEQAKGRMRYLSQVAAMSSISLEVIPDAIAQPVVEPGWAPLVIVKDALRSLVGTLQWLATVAIWVILYIVPIFGIPGLVIYALWKLARRKARARVA
ncbi:MAG TPA: DUF4349 domain-containing protein [Thermoanaerobaculia bacterium]|jgi:hypothetical protein|nr:DUF4349 domain-containing protein [Thermoanaerobaculia bacterium]